MRETNGNTTHQVPPSDFGIRVMDGEEVIFSLRPYRFVRYAVVSTSMAAAMLLILLGGAMSPFWLDFVRNGKSFPPAWGAVVICFLPLLSLVWALIAQRRYHYWLTNKRVIWCHGFIGYQVRSVPLERIADVIISRSFYEMVAGMSSIVVRDMTGQARPGQDASAKWIGVMDAPEVQKRILEQIRKVNELSKPV